MSQASWLLARRLLRIAHAWLRGGSILVWREQAIQIDQEKFRNFN
jgi:hypothetical protein